MHFPSLAPGGLAAASAVLLALPATSQELLRREPGNRPLVAWHRPSADPAFPTTGWFGAGDRFKAHLAADQMTITAYMGDAVPSNRALAWRTTSIALGQELREATAGDALRPSQDDRLEIVRGAVDECWQLRADGIEQTFVVAKRPARPGAVVVRGKLRGQELVPERSEGSGHRGIDWLDADTGRRVFHFGAATAVDADGRSWPLETHWQGTGSDLDVTLRVPAAIVAEASYPLVIDPLVGADLLTTIADGTLSAFTASPTEYGRLTVEERAASATDVDLFVSIWRSSGGSTTRSMVYSDLSSSYASVEADAVHVRGANRYAVGFVRRSSTFSRVRVALIDETATTFGQGQVAVLNEFVPGSLDSNPALSGNQALGVTILLAAEVSVPVGLTGRQPQIHGLWLNTSNGSVARAPFLMAAPNPTTTDLYQPSTLPFRDDGEDQFVSLFGRRHSTGDTEVWLFRQRFDGSTQSLGILASSSQPDWVHDDLHIAGADGEFVAAWTDVEEQQTFPYTRTIRGSTIARFRLRSGDTAPQDLRITEFRAGAFQPNFGAPRLEDLAHDDRTGSHWLAAFDLGIGQTDAGVRIVRLGWDGGVTEVSLPDLPITVGPSAARTPAGPFLADHGPYNFACAYQVRTTTNFPPVDDLFVQTWAPSLGISAFQSAGCGGGTLDVFSFPESGNHFFGLTLTGAPPLRATSLLISFAVGNVPLDFLGATGCVIGLDPALTLDVPTAPTDGAGETFYPLPIPDGLVGRFFAQWVVLAADAPGGLLLSNAQRVIIR